MEIPTTKSEGESSHAITSFNWFDAIDGSAATEPDPSATTKDRDGNDGKPKKKSEIDHSNPLRRGDNSTII
jgi:hypothetical protein